MTPLSISLIPRAAMAKGFRPKITIDHNSTCDPSTEDCPSHEGIGTGAIVAIAVGIVFILGTALILWSKKTSKARARAGNAEKLGGSSSVNTAYMPIGQPFEGATHDTAPLIAPPMPLKFSSAAPGLVQAPAYSQGHGAANDYYNMSYASGGYPQQTGARPY